VTTQIIVRATHNWPVEVQMLSLTGGPAVVHRVEAGRDGTFHVHSGADLLIHEIQPADDAAGAFPEEPILKHFAWAHLPEHLQPVSRPFGMLAARVVATSPRSAERSACLRKLLEAKDCAVRAALEVTP
jgi:hypothetical protein